MESSSVAGKSVRELAQHGFLGQDGTAEITAQQVAEVVAVLYEEGLVEAQLGAQFGVPRGVDSALARHQQYGIAGDQMDQREREQRHAEKSGNDEADAGNDEPQHGKAVPGDGSLGPRRPRSCLKPDRQRYLRSTP